MREFWTNPKRVAACTVPLSSLCCLWLNWTQAVGISGTDIIEWRDSGVRSSKQLWNPYWAAAQPEGPAKWKEWKRGKEQDLVPSTTWCLFVKVWLSAWSADTCAAGDLSLSVTDLGASSASSCSPPVGTELYLDLSPRACALPMTRSQVWNSQGIRRGLYQGWIGASWGF